MATRRASLQEKPDPQVRSQARASITSEHAKLDPTGRSDEQSEEFIRMRTTPLPYAGRLGGNQEFIVDPSDPDAQSLLERVPDASPWMSYGAIFSPRGFKEASLWKTAFGEGVATLMLCYITIMLSSSPPLNVQPSPIPTGASGVFGTINFLGPLLGSITNIIVVTLFIFTFGSITGGHLNPMITIATFFCRLTSLPRMVLYVGFQMAGATLAGLLVRASHDSADWKSGGCFFDPHTVGVRQMFTMEFTSSLALLFLAFGVGLDPRQASTFGPALAPILVGVALGVVCLATAFTVPGYGGAGMNPARCLGVWVGSGHSLGVTAANPELGYQNSNGDRLWIYWIGPIAAGIAHAVMYLLLPPWSLSGTGELEVKKPKPQQDALGRANV